MTIAKPKISAAVSAVKAIMMFFFFMDINSLTLPDKQDLFQTVLLSDSIQNPSSREDYITKFRRKQ